MALRGDSPYGRLHPYPPALEPVDVGMAQADRAGAAQAFGLLCAAEQLLAHCAADPPTNQQQHQVSYQPEPHRHYGINGHEMDHLTAALGISYDLTSLLLEIVAWADLLVLTADETVWLPTPAYAAWRAAMPTERWFTLAEAWLPMHRLAGLEAEYSPDFHDPKTVLGPNLSTSPEARRRPLDVLAELG